MSIIDAEKLDRLRADQTVLRDALQAAINIASEAADEWDKAPQGMRAGKILLALCGHLKGYRPDIDLIHATLANSLRRQTDEIEEIAQIIDPRAFNPDEWSAHSDVQSGRIEDAQERARKTARQIIAVRS